MRRCALLKLHPLDRVQHGCVAAGGSIRLSSLTETPVSQISDTISCNEFILCGACRQRRQRQRRCASSGCMKTPPPSSLASQSSQASAGNLPACAGSQPSAPSDPVTCHTLASLVELGLL